MKVLSILALVLFVGGSAMASSHSKEDAAKKAHDDHGKPAPSASPAASPKK